MLHSQIMLTSLIWICVSGSFLGFQQMRSWIVFSLAFFQHPFAICENISVTFFNKELGYQISLTYYGSIAQITCNSKSTKWIRLQNPANVVIATAKADTKLKHNITVDESFLLGKYVCTFNGKDPVSTSISYRFCSPNETAKCPQTSCPLSNCVITEGNHVTDTCQYFTKENICPSKTALPFYACSASGIPGDLCNIFLSDDYLPWYERSGEGCGVDRTVGSIFVRNLNTVENIAENYAKVVVNNVVYYALPIGSTMLIDLPYEIYFNCSANFHTGYVTWFHDGRRLDAAYKCDGKTTVNLGKIDFPAVNFLENNKIQFGDFFLVGNVYPHSWAEEKVRTYEPPVVADCGTIAGTTKIRMNCFFADSNHDQIPPAFSTRLTWKLDDIEKKSTNMTKNGLWIDLDNSDDRIYTCVGALIYEACAVYGNVRFNQSSKKRLSPKHQSCSDNVIYNVSTTTETNTHQPSEKEDESDVSIHVIMSLIFVSIVTPTVVGLIIYFVVRWYCEKRVRDMLGGSTIAPTATATHEAKVKSVQRKSAKRKFTKSPTTKSVKSAAYRSSKK